MNPTPAGVPSDATAITAALAPMTLYAHDMQPAPGPISAEAVGYRRFHAQLLGGVGDGRIVQLPELSSTIVVSLAAGQLVVTPEMEGRTVPAGGTIYRLVEPVGPETPVYVGASWA
jgi:hypothetical protein